MKYFKIIRISAVVVAILAVAYAALYLHKRTVPQEKPQTYIYAGYQFASYDEGRFYRVGPVMSPDGEYSDGDIGDPVKFCDPASGWVCIEGRVFKFAVPRRTLEVGDHWMFSGVEYSLLPSYRETIPGGIDPKSYSPLWHYQILGRRYELYAIKTGNKDSKRFTIFLYSPERGLLGYIPLEGGMKERDPRNSTFWLTGEYGPGSTEFDSHIVAKACISPRDVVALAK